MTFKSGASFDGKRASSGGRGRGGMIATGGGVGSLLLIGLYLLLGGDPGAITGSQSQPDQTQVGPEESGEDAFAHCKTAEDGNEYDDCRVMFAAQSVDKVWETVLPEQAGLDYVEPGRVIFSNTTVSGCGQASGATGPFYCPADESAYFDTAFFDQLRNFGGENAPLAQMYIVAHEFGHHIQKIEGTLSLSKYNDPGEDSNAVKIELQADCYAGLWAHYADKGEDALLETITEQQVTDAVNTARAVGDDNIQRRSGGEVRPDTWTHGSSEDRAKYFLAGYESGKMEQCDTLERGVYKS